MKSSHTKYLLGIALLAVWGLVGFQLYSKMGNKNQAYIPFTEKPIEQLPQQRDTFALLANYRDPFLGKKLKRTKTNVSPSKVRSTKAKANPAKAVKPKPKPKPKKSIVFPKMIYKGHISLKQGREVALVNVDGKSLNLAWGERYGELTVTKIYEDSLKVSYQGEEQLILKASK